MTKKSAAFIPQACGFGRHVYYAAGYGARRTAHRAGGSGGLRPVPQTKG
ncbi:MAG: hypothetical protein V3T44_08645 [bacterium]